LTTIPRLIFYAVVAFALGLSRSGNCLNLARHTPQSARPLRLKSFWSAVFVSCQTDQPLELPPAARALLFLRLVYERLVEPWRRRRSAARHSRVFGPVISH
jgi:hypothetical protein